MRNNQIKTYFADGSSNFYIVYEYPDTCPICHTTIDPIPLSAYYSLSSQDVKKMESIWRCPSKKCSRIFISYYADGKYNGSLPLYPEKPNIEEDIVKISPRFVEVYTQALAAKANNLLELEGMGLRKALEIIIKDFCISKNKLEAASIGKLSLFRCIETYCDGNVKKCAHKCRVLGNDETHYDRKYDSKDINDLEKLIKATMYWIGADLITHSYDDIKL